mmetsp:Transcript_18470/g.51520  ORF Transcript_18470/g.51520 Transcript_18470/m.51520 type:complete len:222 (+) Transcript_18470:636-1301(+)
MLAAILRSGDVLGKQWNQRCRSGRGSHRHQFQSSHSAYRSVHLPRIIARGAAAITTNTATITTAATPSAAVPVPVPVPVMAASRDSPRCPLAKGGPDRHRNVRGLREAGVGHPRYTGPEAVSVPGKEGMSGRGRGRQQRRGGGGRGCRGRRSRMMMLMQIVLMWIVMMMMMMMMMMMSRSTRARGGIPPSGEFDRHGSDGSIDGSMFCSLAVCCYCCCCCY